MIMATWEETVSDRDEEMQRVKEREKERERDREGKRVS